MDDAKLLAKTKNLMTGEAIGGDTAAVCASDLRHPAPVGGVLVLDKPEGITSAKAAAKVKKLLKPRKIGHTGTLDPFATGVLVLCLDEATRASDQIVGLDKVYRATLCFGVETDTQDKTGQVIGRSDVVFCENDLLEVLGDFLRRVPADRSQVFGGKGRWPKAL